MFNLGSIVGSISKTAGSTIDAKIGSNSITLTASAANDYVINVGAGAFSVAFTKSNVAATADARLYDDNGVLVAANAESTTTVAAGKYHIVVYTSVADTITMTVTAELTATMLADKVKYNDMRSKLRLGYAYEDDDVIFYKVGGDSVWATQIMTALDAGGGFNELKTLGLSDSLAIDVLSIYNVRVSPTKYESELGIKTLEETPTLLGDFLTYLVTNNVDLPSLTGLFVDIRSNTAIFTALKNWNATLV